MTYREFNKSLLVTRDTAANAAYIYLRRMHADETVKRTICVDVPHGMVNLDIDANGRLLGIEILNASKILPDNLMS